MITAQHLRLFIFTITHLFIQSYLVPQISFSSDFSEIKQNQSAQPNVIIVLVDNFGNGDLGCYGSKLHRTENIDRLAREGCRFTSFYVSSGVCTPSRASLMTGCFPRRINLHESDTGGAVLQPVSAKGLNPSETTIAEVFKSKGYATACIGKWHLGDQPEFLPTKQGFDRFFGIPYSDDMTRDKRPQSWPELPLMRQEKVIEAPTERNLLVQKCTQEALNFIKESTSAGHPFFLYLPHTMPGSTAHPFSSPAFQGKSSNGAYGDAVEELDWSTGEIMKCLDDLKIAENTLFIWTSDNGAVRRQPLQGSNSPYRGWGYDTSEGAMRMPCIMRWGSIIPAGTVNDSICSTLDLLPTVAEIIQTDLPQNPIDGKSILNVLKNPQVMDSHWDKSGFLYYFMGQLQAIRSGPYKLYLPLKNKFQSLNRKTMESTVELYNVRTDVAENQEISQSHQETVNRLLTLAEMARSELGDIDRKGHGEREAGSSPNPRPLLLPKIKE